MNTVKEEIGFKLEKDLVGECDIIDGVMVTEICIGLKQNSIQIGLLLQIRSFTTMDGLEQFVARSEPKQAKKLSPHLKKVKKIAPSPSGYSERDMSRMDASLFVLSEEPYYEDYSELFLLYWIFWIL